MKKIYNIFFTLAAVFALAACSEEENPYTAPEKTIEIVSTDVVFAPEGGQGTIAFTATGSVTATSDRDWCVVSVNGSAVIVNVDTWGELETRYANVTLKSGSYSVNVSVQQYGTVLSGLTDATVVAEAEGITQVFQIQANSDVTVTTEQDWISPSVEDGLVTVVVAANTESATRFGAVTVAAGANAHQITIKQYPEYVVEEDWDPYYDGRQRNSRGTLYEVLANEVADDSEAGYYMIMYGSVADYEASKLKTEDAYIKSLVAQGEKDIVDMIAYYANYGYDLTPVDLMYNESDYDYFNILEAGDYYVVVAGYDEDGYPTGQYAYNPFTILDTTNEPTWNAEYGGNYKYGSTVYDIVSYTVGDSDKFMAAVFSEDDYENNFYSDFTNVINGYAAYVAEEQPELREGSINLLYNRFSNGTYHIFMVGFDDEYNLSGKVFTTTFTIHEEPTAAYSAWLGDWKITTPRVQSGVENQDIWTIEAGTVNGDYLVSNFGGHPSNYGFTVTLTFNAETGGITCANGQVVGDDITLSNGNVATPTLLGKAINPSTGNVSRISGNYTVFTGEIDEDGSATLTPGTISISSWTPSTNPLSGVQIYGVYSSGASYWRTETPLPNVLTRDTEGVVSKKNVSRYQDMSVAFETLEPVVTGFGVQTAAKVNATFAQDVEIPSVKAGAVKEKLFIRK